MGVRRESKHEVIEAMRRRYRGAGRAEKGRLSSGLLDGPVDQWVNELTALAVEHGMDSYILGVDGPPEAQLRRFALEVVPQVRENVARHRMT